MTGLGAPHRNEADMSVTIYHNPRCSKSRETLNLLMERSIEPDVIEYLILNGDR